MFCLGGSQLSEYPLFRLLTTANGYVQLPSSRAMPMRQLRMVRSITRRRNSDTHHALKIFTYSLVMTCSFCSASGFVYVQHGLVVLEVSTFSSLLWKVIYPGYLSEVQKIEHG